MTPEQLAQHWQVSVQEAENISRFINQWYKLGVVPVFEKGETRWQGVLYAYDPRNKYILMKSDKKFVNQDRAVLYWTNYMHRYQISQGQAQQMRSGQGVPTDVYLALKPIEGYERIVQKTRSLNATLNRLMKEK